MQPCASEALHAAAGLMRALQYADLEPLSCEQCAASQSAQSAAYDEDIVHSECLLVLFDVVVELSEGLDGGELSF